MDRSRSHIANALFFALIPKLCGASSLFSLSTFAGVGDIYFREENSKFENNTVIVIIESENDLEALFSLQHRASPASLFTL